MWPHRAHCISLSFCSICLPPPSFDLLIWIGPTGANNANFGNGTIRCFAQGSFFAFVVISFLCSGSSPPPSAASTLAPPSPSRGRPGNRRSKGFLCHPLLPSLDEIRWVSVSMKFPYAFSYSVQIYSFLPSPLALSFPSGNPKQQRRASQRNSFLE